MSEELFNTREVARYLGIHEKQVYSLVKEKRIPATRLTGKWVFPKKLIDEWLEKDARVGLEEAHRKSRRLPGALLAAGSNDPLLDLLQTALRENHPEMYIFSASIGSTAGLRALDTGHIDLAWSHLLDPESGDYNIPFLPRLTPRISPVVVNLFFRDLGFVTAPGNPLGIGGFEDLARPDVRFVNRQAGSGTRILLDHHLSRLGIDSTAVTGYDREVATHFEAARTVLEGDADTALASGSAATLLRLGFTPVTRERFDMVLDQATFFTPSFQALLELLNGPSFGARAARLGHYDFSRSGKIVHARHQMEARL